MPAGGILSYNDAADGGIHCRRDGLNAHPTRSGLGTIRIDTHFRFPQLVITVGIGHQPGRVQFVDNFLRILRQLVPVPPLYRDFHREAS